MTLCIAAICMDDRFGAKAVLGYDWRVETDIASSDTEFKFDFVSKHWAVLLAGPIAQARDLADRYKAFLRKEEGSLTRLNVLERLQKPVQDLRESLADKYTHAMLAVSYEEFLENGAAYFTEDIRRQIINDITAQRIEAELILIGYVEGAFMLMMCANGEVIQFGDFATIGSGHAIAEATLRQREQHELIHLPETLYCVYEAMRLGAISPGVGRPSFMILGAHPGARQA